jgi:ribonuclease P protein subunit RPR2
MAGTFLLAEQRLDGYVMAVFGVPIAMLWVAQKQYLDRTRTSVEELRRSADQLRTLLAEKEDLIGRMHYSYLSTITSLARSIEARDPYTGGHTERVSTIAHALGAQLGFDVDELRAVEVGAIVHDIGKIGIPDEILLKPGSLSEEEFDQMRRHPDIASYILAELDLPPIVKQMTRSHHERYDGCGYPDGLAGEEIPLAARVLTVADALDAMTSDRPYRRAMPLEVAHREIEAKAGTQFCPSVVAALRECLASDQSFRALFAGQNVAA